MGTKKLSKREKAAYIRGAQDALDAASDFDPEDDDLEGDPDEEDGDGDGDDAEDE